MILIDDVVDILSGYAFDSKLFNDKGNGIPLVRIRDVGKKHSNTFYSGVCKSEYILNDGDFIIGMDGDFRLAEWQGGAALLNQRVCKISPKKDLIEPKYLYYALPKELKKIEDITSFATVKHLSVKKIKSIQITLPSLAEQQKIAAILDAADQLRQKNQQLIEHYTRLGQSLFLEMFGDPMRNPKGWKIKTMKAIGSVSTGNTPPRANPEYYGDHIEWIKTNNINTPHMHLTNAEECLSENGLSIGRSVEKGSLLVTCIAGSKKVIGNVAITNRKVAFNQQINSFTPDMGNILFYYHMFIIGQKYVQSFSTDGMKGMISKSKFESINFICPPIALQNQFAQHIEAIEQQKQSAQASLEKSEALFNSLLQRAFKGELTGKC